MKCIDRKKHPWITFISILAVAILSFTGVGCGNEYGDFYNKYQNTSNPAAGAYLEDTDSTPVAGGGELKAFVERQQYGVPSSGGDSLKVRYYLYNNYTGNSTVKEIRATWNVKAQFKRRTSESFDAGINIGVDEVGATVGSGSSSEYQNLSVDWYSSNTNGVKSVYYGASNYTLFPFKQLNSHSIENNAYLRIAGHTTSFSISAVV